MNISKKESLSIKGVAIIMIAIHNFVRIIDLKECNEFEYDWTNVVTFLTDFIHRPFFSFASFLGWMGVPLFVFISGYGLQEKYGKDHLCLRSFYTQHVGKLLALFLPCYLIFVGSAVFDLVPYNVSVENVILQSTLLINFFPDQSSIPGVYWYMGMAMQLYLIYPFIVRLTTQNLLLLVVITTIVLTAIGCYDLALAHYFRHNSLGWMHVFGAGMLFSKCTISFTQKWYVRVLIVLALFLGHLTPQTWIVVDFLIVLLFIAFKEFLCKKILVWAGMLSGCVYVIHPIIRSYCKNFDFQKGDMQILMYSMLFLVIIFLLAYCYNVYYRKVKSCIR